jgi:hypothetical protein
MALDSVALKTLAMELAAAMPPEEPAPPFNFAPVDVSPRAIKMRAIVRIANAHNWQDAIVHFLETKGAPYLSDLTEPQLEDLMQRMEGFVDALETGSSLPDCPPAF